MEQIKTAGWNYHPVAWSALKDGASLLQNFLDFQLLSFITWHKITCINIPMGDLQAKNTRQPHGKTISKTLFGNCRLLHRPQPLQRLGKGAKKRNKFFPENALFSRWSTKRRGLRWHKLKFGTKLKDPFWVCSNQRIGSSHFEKPWPVSQSRKGIPRKVLFEAVS